MKLQMDVSSYLALVVFIFLTVSSPRSSSALIEDALDVFHVVKEVTTAVLKAWDIVQRSSYGSDINFPLMREKQRKVLSRLKEVSKQIQRTEDQNAEQVAWAVQSVNNFIESNFQLQSKRKDLTDTMNSITSRFQEMQQYVAHQDKLEDWTLLQFAEWTVSPNADSIHHLMNRLHLTMFGSDDYASRTSSNMLEMLLMAYENAEQVAWAVQSVNNFIESNFQLQSKRKDLTDTMNSITSRFQEMQQYVAHQDKLEDWTLLQFAEWTVSPNADSIHHLMNRLHLTMFGSDDYASRTSSNMLEMLLMAYEVSKEERCLNQQSTQQFIYSLYTDIACTELKAYTMMEFSWMILKLYGKGNFTQEAELMRNDYEKRTEKTVNRLREVMQRGTMDERIVWRCDPDKYVSGKNYEEVTRLVQGYVENEVDLNNKAECWNTCGDYDYAKNEGCFKDKFCAKQERCTGNIYNCRYVDSDMTICPSGRDSVRRYEYIEYENGVTYGKVSKCPRGKTAVDSWWRYLFWHCTYCFCLCDDKYNAKTDRYFNLRETLSNINDNMVVTGLRFTKTNRVFHLQIQEGHLSPRGVVNESTLAWKPVDNYTLTEKGIHNSRDYHTLSYDARSIDLDDVHTDDNTFVVTGVRFRVIGKHLNLEARLSEFSFETGQLVNPQENSFWKSNDNTDVSGDRRAKIELKDPDLPIYTIAKSVPDSRHNQYLEFSESSFYKDASQSTIPFIDTQDVISIPAVPLAGVGIYHKGRPGFGGFIAPKLMTYDFAPHIRTPRKA